MNKLKIILMICMFMISFISVNALDDTNVIYYFDFDSGFIDNDYSSVSLTSDGGTRSITGTNAKLGNGSLLGNDLQQSYSDGGALLPIGDNKRSLSFWFNITQTDSTATGFFAQYDTWAVNKYFYSYVNPSRTLYIAFNGDTQCGVPSIINFNEWTHFALSYDSDN